MHYRISIVNPNLQPDKRTVDLAALGGQRVHREISAECRTDAQTALGLKLVYGLSGQLHDEQRLLDTLYPLKIIYRILTGDAGQHQRQG